MSKSILQTLRPQHAFRTLKPTTRRTFLNVPGTESQTITALRILPYNSNSLYRLIADIDSYSEFIPYCTSSKVTKWSEPTSEGKRWPSEADLKVGWGGMDETFTSRLFCIPGEVVEALGGEAVTSLPKADLKHHTATLDTPAAGNKIFKSLNTQWRLKPFHYKPPSGKPQTDMTEHPAKEQTEVHLSIEYQFANPMYGALSSAVAPKLAGTMIEAFEKRARKVLDGPGANVPENSPRADAANAS
jgi:coenzyme Q-binding protein COQ10